MERDDVLKTAKVHRDPWERFAILDAEYYLPILINNLYLSQDEQALIIWMIVHSVEHDLISYWDLPQQELVQVFLRYCQENRSIIGEKNIFQFLSVYNQSGQQARDKGISHVLNNFMEGFYTEMREQGKLREFKKDYSD
jgi:hypothetical protein